MIGTQNPARLRGHMPTEDKSLRDADSSLTKASNFRSMVITSALAELTLLNCSELDTPS